MHDSIAAFAWHTEPAPSTEATTERYDSYRMIHKGLRALMAETLVSLGRLDTAEDEETRAVIERVRISIELGEAHLSKEEAFVHPAMEARAPGSTRRAAAGHVAHAAEYDRIRAACRDVEAARGAARAAAALRLYRRYALLMAEDLIHMDVEEIENNAVLWATHTDAEIAQLTDRLVASIPPETLRKYLRWMVTANTPSDRATLLDGIRVKLPAPAYASLVDGVLPHLPERDRRTLSATAKG